MENGSVRDTWKWPTGSREGCGMPRYFGPLRRRPTNKCSETITTPQRTNTFRSREMSVAWVFVVRWFANHTVAQVIVNRSLKQEHQSASQCRTPQICNVALLSCGKLSQGREGRAEMRHIGEEVAGDRYAVLKERKRARERERVSQPAQERLWHSVIPGELPHAAFGCLTLLSYLSIGGAECISFKSTLFYSFYKAAYFTKHLHLKKKNKNYAILMKISPSKWMVTKGSQYGPRSSLSLKRLSPYPVTTWWQPVELHTDSSLEDTRFNTYHIEVFQGFWCHHPPSLFRTVRVLMACSVFCENTLLANVNNSYF